MNMKRKRNWEKRTQEKRELGMAIRGTTVKMLKTGKKDKIRGTGRNARWHVKQRQRDSTTWPKIAKDHNQRQRREKKKAEVGKNQQLTNGREDWSSKAETRLRQRRV